MNIFLYLKVYALNWLNLLDHAGNTLLLGDADETLSARIARARNHNHAWAFQACRALSFAVKLLTFGKIVRDHCDHALDHTPTNSREIWNWNDNSINIEPLNEVQVIDIDRLSR